MAALADRPRRPRPTAAVLAAAVLALLGCRGRVPLAPPPSATTATAPAAADRLGPCVPAFAVLGRDGLVVHAGGVVRRLAPPDAVDTFCFDRGGAAVIVTHGRELARITLEGQRTTLLEAAGEVRFPDVSPRDGRIAFGLLDGSGAGEGWSIAIVDAQGADLRVLAAGYDPSFTPDGDALVYEAYEPTGPDLWRIAVDEPRATPERLAPARASGRHAAAVAPDGASVVFSAERRLWSLDLASRTERALTPPGAYDRFASFTADGAGLVFYRQEQERERLVLWRDGAERVLVADGARLGACAPSEPDSAAIPHSRAVTDGVARSSRGVGPRVLGVIAHPDDEFAFAGVLFKTATHLDGVCELLTITDGQGGFKYATFGAALHGLDLTDEEVGRRELPRIRLAEQVESARLLGVSALHYLGQPDHRYTTDLAEILAPDSRTWDLAEVRRALDARLAAGRYDFVLVHPPTVTTHAHHQAASLLALEAVARMPPGQRPLVLCAESEDGPDNGPPWLLPPERSAQPTARTTAGPYVFDRTQPFGYRGRLDYRPVIDAALGRHVTQGTALRGLGRGTREELWLLGDESAEARERCARWFARLAEPQFPGREYGDSAGVNTGAGAPER